MAAKCTIHFWIGEGVLKSTEVVETSAEESEQLRALRQQLVSQNQVYNPHELALIFNEKPELAELREQAEAMKGKPDRKSVV